MATRRQGNQELFVVSWKSRVSLGWASTWNVCFPFSISALSVGWQEGHSTRNKLKVVCWWWWVDWMFTSALPQLSYWQHCTNEHINSRSIRKSRHLKWTSGLQRWARSSFVEAEAEVEAEFHNKYNAHCYCVVTVICTNIIFYEIPEDAETLGITLPVGHLLKNWTIFWCI